MQQVKRYVICFFVLISAVVAGPSGAGAGGMPVCVTIEPLAFFAEQIGGPLVDVSVLVPPGASPAVYEPKPRQMAGLVKTRLLFSVDVPMERVWLPRIQSQNPSLEVVPVHQGIQKFAMEGSHGHEGEEHGEHDPDHGGILDPHVWLSPANAFLISRNILTALVQADPDNRALYSENYTRLVNRIAQLDRDLLNVFSQTGPRARFLVFHPSWGYFARAYGLEQVAVEQEGKEPTPRQMQKIISTAKKEGISVVFVQPQFSQKSAGAIASAINGQVAVADPLARDWEANLRRAAARFAKAAR